MKIKTKKLQNCLRVLSTEQYYELKDRSKYPGEDDAKKRFDRLLNLLPEVAQVNLDLSSTYIKPVVKELNKNLLNTESLEGKEGIIRFYIWEFREMALFFSRIIESKAQYEQEWIYEYYLIQSKSILDDIFEEIQFACFKYGIDFDLICKELRFPIDSINFITDLLKGSVKKTLSSFSEIFTEENWKPLIDILMEVDPPLIDKDYNFLGKDNGHIGVIGCWLKELQVKGKIQTKINRQTMAAVLNNEIKGLGMGKDGKSITNFSQLYHDEFKLKLLKATNLLPEKSFGKPR